MHDERAEKVSDDLSAYVATLDESERSDVAAAEAAIDIAVLLYRARAYRGLTQTAAAQRAGLLQQAVSRFERPNANVQLSTVQHYLSALGYVVDISVRDPETGEIAAHVSLPSDAPPRRSRSTAA
jgi:DNA-binding XRE family transcriptional regulator